MSSKCNESSDTNTLAVSLLSIGRQSVGDVSDDVYVCQRAIFKANTAVPKFY